MGPFMDAVPGLHDAVHLGKVFDLTQETNASGQPDWDLIIVDAPATGHGLHMIRAPRAMMDLTRAGPVFEGVRQVDEVVSNPQTTAILATCLPEEMPINETISLWQELGPCQPLFAACVLNEVAHLPTLRRDDWSTAREVFLQHPDPAVVEAAQLTDEWTERIDRQEQARQRLVSQLPCPVVELPLLFHRNLGFSDLQHLSHQLANDLGDTCAPR